MKPETLNFKPKTMNDQQNGFPLDEIHRIIEAKRATYEGIAAKAHKTNHPVAERIINNELETYLNRLQGYWNDPQSHRNGDPTLTPAQGVNIFLEVVQSGLSFSKVAGHIYLSRLKGTGTAVGYQLTADGLIYKAQKAGAIDHLSEPVLVQQGEKFAINNTGDGKQVADHTILFDGRPKFNFDNLLLGYVYIVYPGGDRELSWIGRNRLEEYRQKSLNKNMYNDESFIQTKVIKHALRKVRKTDFMMQLQAEEEEAVTEAREWESPQSPAHEKPKEPERAPEPEPQATSSIGNEPF